MAENWILNASPLIVLARIGREDLIFGQVDQVVVPRAVVTEIEAGPIHDQARRLLMAGHFTIVDTPSPPPELLSWDLGSGETAVLSLAMAETNWTAILDDAAARKCALSFSISVKGTLAIVLTARKIGLIPSAGPVIQALIDIGFHIDESIIKKALAQTVGRSGHLNVITVKHLIFKLLNVGFWYNSRYPVEQKDGQGKLVMRSGHITPDFYFFYHPL